MINKYDAFVRDKEESILLESSVALIMEAKIKYMPEFKNMLKEVDSPISGKIAGLEGADLDVATNMIDLDTKKEDEILFVPENRLNDCVVVDETRISKELIEYIAKSGAIDGEIGVPKNGQRCEVVRQMTIEEICDALSLPIDFYRDSLPAVLKHIKWREGGKVMNAVIGQSGIEMVRPKPSVLKIGKFVGRLLSAAGEKVSSAELEDFVNKWKSAIKMHNSAFDRFEVVSGSDIKRWYNEGCYVKGGGSLNKSCMRYSKCGDFLDIYSRNPQSCRLLIFKDESDKLLGRALVWKVKDLETKEDCGYFMDRIYTVNGSDEKLFIRYAVENGWMFKMHQDSHAETAIMKNKNDRSEHSKIYVEEVGEYKKYPYCDTMKYLSLEKDILHNSYRDGYDLELCETNGGPGSCSTCEGEGRIYCGECNGEGNYSCDECYGEGEVDCSTCDGEGKEECDYCDGNGDNECSTCDGSGKVEGNEEGEEEDCSDCGGEGREKCGHCDGEGSRECGRCDGDGRRTCRHCDSGQVECGNCGGSGREDCPDCN